MMTIRKPKSRQGGEQAVLREEDMTSGSNSTGCKRCGGFLVPYWVVSLKNDGGDVESLTSRCVQCGEVFDRVILTNRDAAGVQHREQKVSKVRNQSLVNHS